MVLYLGAVAFDQVYLRGRGVGWNANRNGAADTVGAESAGRPMVARRGRDDAALALSGIQGVELVEPAADLERARDLVILQLEEDLALTEPLEVR